MLVEVKWMGSAGEPGSLFLLFTHCNFSSELRRCVLVGVCLDEQLVDEVPREAHDATVDM
jgi:hypothetical protein